jgi:hypothetical protein
MLTRQVITYMSLPRATITSRRIRPVLTRRARDPLHYLYCPYLQQSKLQL